mmetsp:Transcript_9330/g.19081  ORF Transcript_9330/g.19081 Transcript_9330/m.19081 type:complete len:85 (-) Transcript_9330:1512-1766(-)
MDSVEFGHGLSRVWFFDATALYTPRVEGCVRVCRLCVFLSGLDLANQGVPWIECVFDHGWDDQSSFGDSEQRPPPGGNASVSIA